jgi:hypothetical protein
MCHIRQKLIQSYVDIPPENDFQRGYFCALMEEAVDDFVDAQSETVVKAVELVRDDLVLYNNWSRRRRAASV